MNENKEVQSGYEAESENLENTPPEIVLEDAAQSPSEKGKKKGKKKGKTFQENIITDSETARERGHNGGVRSGEVRRAQRDARATIQYMLGRMTKSKNVKANLEELGFEEDEYSNMAALHGRLFTMAMSGDLEAYITLMRMGGYEPEEIRKERESISSDRRREVELDAKVAALGQRGADASVSVSMTDEDDHDDVVIYMPQIQSEESCQEAPEEKAETGVTDDPSVGVE